ncbi:MAG TPA: tetratricopeptide repeat protein, partial [Flavipsychrobacter sp.]|nr:tetratricopeptide repeat protein [Flavipsychrobacter sp.]
KADYYVTRSLLKKGAIDSAYSNTVSFLNKMEERNLQNIQAYRMFLGTRANLLIRKGEFKDAIEQYYRLRHTSEKNNDRGFEILATNGIGWAYMEMGRYPDALHFFHEAMAMDTRNEYSRYLNNTLSNIAAVQNSVGRNDSAAIYIKRSIATAEQNEDLATLANALNIEASIYIDAGQAQKAEAPLNRALALRKQVGDPFYIVSDISQLASYYAHNGDPQKGITLCLQGIEMARQYGLNSKLRLLYNALAENYKAAGDKEAYGKTLETLLSLNDSLYSQNAAADLASITASYELQKKENIIIRQKLSLVQKNYLFYSALGVLLVTGVFSIITFRNYRKKQKLRIELLMQEERRKANDAVKEAEENERKRIAADLHDNLGVYAAAIASNIDHALKKDGEQEKAMGELKANAQTMVSQLSDTIWALKKDTLSLTALSDRVKIFLQRIQPSYPDISMEVSEHIDNDLLLSPSQAYHLFCIVQEGVTNAVKHSNGDEVSVCISSNGSWKISISDNGKGMQRAKEIQGSDGLHNMQTRAKGNKWQLSWTDNNGKGTIVNIHPE